MTDPCGIVDTIQSNFNAIEYGESAASVACIGAKDTTSGPPLLTAGDGGASDGALPNDANASEEQDPSKAVGGEEKEDGDTPDDGKDAGEESPNDNSNNDEKAKAKEEPTKSHGHHSKPKIISGLLKKWSSRAKLDDALEDDKEEEPPKMAPVSDLSDLSRKICVVTTAGLPWRTGTAVNPLARALYLTRGRPKHSVTLMIPWLETREEQAKVYGSNIFETPEEQEAWTRNYSRERILNSADENEEGTEVDNLQIRFYPAKYHTLFGSIFATVDICALIPEEEADIAILEEPEHLTWFRSLPPSSSGRDSSSTASTNTSAMESMMDNDNSCGSCPAVSDEEMESSEHDNDKDHSTSDENDQMKLEELAIIGWTAKFSYVVGILHTNYSAYMRQYGLGASIVTASALQALSSVCVKAYTHRLIRLSDTLPELDTPKEITCNVHGVRSEFFVAEEPIEEGTAAAEVQAQADSAPAESKEPQLESEGEKVEGAGTEQTLISGSDTKMECSDGGNLETTDFDGDSGNISNVIEDCERFQPEPVYFIGKVIWAKGFDKILEIEDMFRKETGDYFPIDVYGSGGDFEAISRAFLGRSGLGKKVLSSGSVKSLDSSRSPRSKSPSPSPKDQTAALLFSKEGNLRGQITDLETIPSSELVVEVQTCETPVNGDDGVPSSARNYPKDIMGHLGEKTKETGTGVTKAIAKLSEKITHLGFRSLYREEADDSDTNEEGTTDTGSSLASKFRFDPPKSRYELRRHSIPARFLGVKDHALLRDIPGHKIFVNLSITEVLCTTTAEALAMGKFVVIPEHPSNTFFLQFPNCLAYVHRKECVENIKFALENDPIPLSVEDRHKLTWEGANVRLYESSLMTEADAEERNKKTGDFARLHMDTMKTGAFFQGLWSRGTHKKSIMKEEKLEDTEETDEKVKTVLGICKA